MKRITGSVTLLLTLTLIMSAGCDIKPPAPMSPDGQVLRALIIDMTDQAELEAVAAVESGRVNYAHRLNVLVAYFDKVGNMTRLIWAQRELKNLETAQTFVWKNAPQILPPPAESLENADERMLVEYAVTARNDYTAAVIALLEYLTNKGPDDYKTLRVANMQDRFDPIRTYLYFMDAEIPSQDLRPSEVDPTADALFEEAVQLHEDGKGILRMFVTTNYQKQREALVKFLDLVRNHPRSTKIGLSAFYIGEIYKEYFNENIRSVGWYERAWQWDPKMEKPARFQAATVWDLRLQDKKKAIELYRQAIEHEQFKRSNVIFSRSRIQELTTQ